MNQHNQEHYDWVDQEPFLKITLTKAGYALPGTVLAEVFNELSKFTLGYYPDVECNQIAAGFECSRVSVGFTPEEAEGMKQYYYGNEWWKNVQGGEPVATWDSGISTGCTSTLFIMPDGSFEWTTP